MSLQIVIDEAHILKLAVLTPYRRSGIGRKLLAHAIELARGESLTALFLEVRMGNEAARALYLKEGFEIVGMRPRYYQDTGEDALLMRLGL